MPYLKKFDPVTKTTSIIAPIEGKDDKLYVEQDSQIKMEVNKFENIQNSTVINNSIVNNSFNKVKTEYGEDIVNALMEVSKFIEKSGDLSARILFDKFNEELNKPQPDKSTIRKIWEGIEKTLPTINALSDVIVKLSPLFMTTPP